MDLLLPGRLCRRPAAQLYTRTSDNIRTEDGGGVSDPTVCAPKMARSDFPIVTLVWGRGSGGGGGGPSHGCSLLRRGLATHCCRASLWTVQFKRDSLRDPPPLPLSALLGSHCRMPGSPRTQRARAGSKAGSRASSQGKEAQRGKHEDDVIRPHMSKSANLHQTMAARLRAKEDVPPTPCNKRSRVYKATQWSTEDLCDMVQHLLFSKYGESLMAVAQEGVFSLPGTVEQTLRRHTCTRAHTHARAHTRVRSAKRPTRAVHTCD